MDAYLYCIYIVGYFILLIWGLRESNLNFWTLSSLLYVVVIGLIVDNGIIVSGKWIGEGAFLEGLNKVRFWSHAFLTPLLVLFSWDLFRRANLEWAKQKWVYALAIVYTKILIRIEFFTETLNLTLKPELKYGVLRYVSTEPSSGPPVMILLVTLILFIVGVILWKKTGWKWMFIGTLVMSLGSMIPIPLGSSAITNGFELILLFTLMMTKNRFDHADNIS